MGAFISKHFPYVFQHFRISYLGIFAPHVWIFCAVHRAGIDYGGVTLGIPLYIALSITMLVVMLLAWRRQATNVVKAAKWPAAAVMAVATVFLTFPLPVSGAETTIAASLICGIGIAWLYLGWAPFYAKLDIKNAIACIFGAMALGSAIKILVDLMPPLPATICMVALPFVSVVLASQAKSHQPPLEREPKIYYEERHSSIPWRILLGVVVYSVIIGVIQSMQVQASYTPMELLTVVHHGAEIVVAFVILWWVFVRRGLLRFASLWQTILLFTATGLFFLPVIGPDWAGWALVCIAIAQTLVVMLFWVMLADVAHHSSASPYAIFGAGWIAYSLSFALGELIGKAASAHDVSVYVLTIMTYLLTLAAVFALNENNITSRRIFADLDMAPPEKSLYASIESDCVELGKRYGLTGREVEVLQLICKGRSKNYIAENLFISENTVRSHSKHIYQKLGVHSKQEILDMIAAAPAAQQGK